MLLSSSHRQRNAMLIALVALALLIGCGGCKTRPAIGLDARLDDTRSSVSDSSSESRDARQHLPRIFGGDRPVELRVPSDFDASRRYPLVVLLHGWGSDPESVRRFTGYDSLVEQGKILLAAPYGRRGLHGDRFWTATLACCAFEFESDDVGYLSSLIAEISATYNVDPRRVYVAGHSNGGFMAYRLACERPSLIAAIVSVAGATFLDESSCSPSSPVSVLQVHGSADDIIDYEGGSLGGTRPPFPSAQQTVRDWAGYNGCSKLPETSPERLDLDATIAAAETSREAVPNCPSGIAVELWTIAGANHFPDFSSGRFASLSWAWLRDHPRPTP